MQPQWKRSSALWPPGLASARLGRALLQGPQRCRSAQLPQEGSSGARTGSLVTAWLFLALSPVVPAWRQLPLGTPGSPCRPRRPRPTPTGPDRGAEGVLCRPRLTPLVSARRSRAGDTGVQGWGLPEAAEGAGARAAGESAFVPGPPARPPKHARLSEIAAELGDRPLGPAPLTSPLHRPQCGRQACRSGFPVLRADRPPVHGALTWCVVFPPAGLLQWWLLPCAGPGSGAPPGNRPGCLLHRRRSSELATLA